MADESLDEMDKYVKEESEWCVNFRGPQICITHNPDSHPTEPYTVTYHHTFRFTTPEAAIAFAKKLLRQRIAAYEASSWSVHGLGVNLNIPKLSGGT